MAEEAGLFAFADVAKAISDKMVRRHPHVFGGATIAGAAAQSLAWEEQKARGAPRPGGGVGQKARARSMAWAWPCPRCPAPKSCKSRAALVGFDWPETAPIFDKIAEEIAELKAEIADHAPPERIEDELGDLLFAVVNLARRLDADPEQALRGKPAANSSAVSDAVEAALAARGRDPASCSLDEMEAEWQRIKAAE